MFPIASSLLVVLCTAALVAAQPASAASLPQVRLDAPRGIVDQPKRPVRVTVRTEGGRVQYRGRAAAEVRGYSSQNFPKKSYAVELRRRDGRGNATPLLGMDRDADWILYASYNDKSLLRNAVGHRLARMLGRSDIETRHVELWLNGRYHGVYVLMERPEVRDGALMELTFDAQATGEPSFRGPVTRRPYLWRHPKRDKLPDEEAEAARERIVAFERALHAPGFADSPGGWRSHLDEASAVDGAVLFELTKQVDAFWASTFFHVRPSGAMTVGPAWDFDIALGNARYNRSRFLRGWMLTGRPLAGRLYQDQRFTAAVARRWREVREAGLIEALVSGIDADARRLEAAAARNFRRWRILGRYVWPNPVDPRTGRIRPTWRSEVAFLRQWIIRRAQWLDANVDRLPASGS
jgi:CotH kinase protein